MITYTTRRRKLSSLVGGLGADEMGYWIGAQPEFRVQQVAESLSCGRARRDTDAPAVLAVSSFDHDPEHP
jgi:hypothetical protein